jgi:hypothetical protein
MKNRLLEEHAAKAGAKAAGKVKKGKPVRA